MALTEESVRSGLVCAHLVSAVVNKLGLLDLFSFTLFVCLQLC